MSETTGTGFIADVRAGDAKRLTIGKLMGGMEARLVDEQDKDVEEGEQGELVSGGDVRGRV
jgi:acyl-coenzyme A synthetase/AMP-(fatty) acid ligase